jgi:hypothetical protein
MFLKTASRLGRFIVTLAAVMFAAVGLGFWVAPEPTAHRLGLEAVHATGLAALRADFGGLFLGLALLCATALWTKRRAWFLATSLMVATIAVGRVIGWAAGGVSPNDAVQLGIELTIVAASIAASRTSAIQH